jgi:hypothetical protein
MFSWPRVCLMSHFSQFGTSTFTHIKACTTYVERTGYCLPLHCLRSKSLTQRSKPLRSSPKSRNVSRTSSYIFVSRPSGPSSSSSIVYRLVGFAEALRIVITVLRNPNQNLTRPNFSETVSHTRTIFGCPISYRISQIPHE